MIRRTLVATCAAVALAGTAACSDGGGDSGDPADEVHETTNITGPWKLTSARVDGTELELIRGQQPVLTVFEGRDGQAIAGCEVATVVVRPNTSGIQVALREIGSMLSCPPMTEPDSTDGSYFEALKRVNRATRADAGLTLEGEGVELQFAHRGRSE